jgi:hypothetical protein
MKVIMGVGFMATTFEKGEVLLTVVIFNAGVLPSSQNS